MKPTLGQTKKLDALVERALHRRSLQLAGQPAFALDGVPRVVIVGAGFGGMAR
ncbi:MAG: hypothetical protein V5B39_13930 [Accumulibacter sp.]|jgi:NADH dehydrogenase|uniref:hypothetical protein n=1 Tax=Accumulibacter sp. TaxID=2053492 RepID=UPI002FC2C02A